VLTVHGGLRFREEVPEKLLAKQSILQVRVLAREYGI
tara:strand:- start:141 stop:251 length:111 start_codon:yes stop_codon:yes gene_type:complete